MFPSMVSQKSHNCDSLQHANHIQRPKMISSTWYLYFDKNDIHMYPIECDMGLDDTLTSHTKQVEKCIFSHEIPLNLSYMRKQNSFETSQTPAENHRVRYGVRSELHLTLKLDRGVQEGPKMILFTVYLTSEYQITKIRECRRWAFWVCLKLPTLLFGKQ